MISSNLYGTPFAWSRRELRTVYRKYLGYIHSLVGTTYGIPSTSLAFTNRSLT
jgi:hypothetical protein